MANQKIYVKINKRLGSKLSSRYKEKIVKENNRSTALIEPNRIVHKTIQEISIKLAYYFVCKLFLGYRLFLPLPKAEVQILNYADSHVVKIGDGYGKIQDGTCKFKHQIDLNSYDNFLQKTRKQPTLK